MVEYRAIMRDELGDEVVVETYRIGEDLDEDYLEMWKDMKIGQLRERYPEAQCFYIENYSAIQRQATIAARDDMYYDPWEDEDYEEDEEWEDEEYEETGNMPCDNYGMGACSSSCPRYYECNA